MEVAIKEKRLLLPMQKDPEETKLTMTRKLVELRYVCIV